MKGKIKKNLSPPPAILFSPWKRCNANDLKQPFNHPQGRGDVVLQICLLDGFALVLSITSALYLLDAQK